MRAILQRVDEASVAINKKEVGKIGKGYLLLVGFTKDDNMQDVLKVCQKIVNLRIFTDEKDKMNLSINDVKGQILSVSQFTLYAKLNGRRPSFSSALSYDQAEELYNVFNETLKTMGQTVETGKFGANMKVSLLNNGPVTIIIDSKEEK
ncbi:MAG: D-aminoacyl-tRNA deacylase [Bacilli bacterium]